MGGQIGHYGPGDLEYLLAHDNTVLEELEDFNWADTQPKAPGGSGLGRLKNKYHKVTGPPEGTFSIVRKMLSYADKGTLFDKMLAGSGMIITEFIATASATHDPAETLVSILEIKLITSGTILAETDDYTVNWATGLITFNAALTENAEIQYISTDKDWIGQNLLQNSGIEDAITNIWSAIATATVARSNAAEYVGTYGLLIVINAANDGGQYDPNIHVYPDREYRLTAMMQGVTVADDCSAHWEDAGGVVQMTAVGTADVLALGVFKLHEWTFTPDEATILSLRILNDDVAAASNIYVDEIYLRENDPRYDVMMSGRNRGYQFEIWARRVLDGVVVAKFRKCEVYDSGKASGEAYTESVNGQFLELDILDV